MNVLSMREDKEGGFYMFNVKKILAVTLAASVCFSGTVLFCNAKNQKKVHINKTSAELNVGESVKLNLKNAVSKTAKTLVGNVVDTVSEEGSF